MATSFNISKYADTTNYDLGFDLYLTVDRIAVNYRTFTSTLRYTVEVKCNTSSTQRYFAAELSIDLSSKGTDDRLSIDIDNTIDVVKSQKVLLSTGTIEIQHGTYNNNASLFYYCSAASGRTINGTYTKASAVISSVTGYNGNYYTNYWTLDAPNPTPAITNVTTLNYSSSLTDEDDFICTYNNPAGAQVSSLKIALSTNTSTSGMITDWMSVSTEQTSCNINLSSEQRDLLLQSFISTMSSVFYFLIQATIDTTNYNAYLKKSIKLVNAAPELTVNVVDTLEKTIGLTGDASILVQHLSTAQISISAVAKKLGTITSVSFSYGDETLTNLSASSSFTISAIPSLNMSCIIRDSRGQTLSWAQSSGIPYIRPTILLKDASITGDDGAGTLTASVEGAFFNGSFGEVTNGLTLSCGLVSGEGDIEATRRDIPFTVPIEGNTYDYTFSIRIPDYKYTNRYAFIVYAVDSVPIETTTAIKYLVAIPLFDWGREDFRFNIPIKLSETSTILLPDGTDLLQLLKTAGIIPSN
jgi:hypothetical protein